MSSISRRNAVPSQSNQGLVAVDAGQHAAEVAALGRPQLERHGELDLASQPAKCAKCAACAAGDRCRAS